MSIHPDEQGAPPQRAAASSEAPGPRGIGTAVAIDWGLTVEFLTFVVLVAVGSVPRTAGLTTPGLRIAAMFGALVAAALFFALGEALRRGRRLAWMLQVGFNVLLLPAGVFLLVGAISDLVHGRVPTVSSTIILVVINPIVVWLLTRPSTRAWTQTTTAQEAAARHGGTWLLWIGLLALAGGVAVAFGV
jgi:hypothetical protein